MDQQNNNNKFFFSIFRLCLWTLWRAIDKTNKQKRCSVSKFGFDPFGKWYIECAIGLLLDHLLYLWSDVCNLYPIHNNLNLCVLGACGRNTESNISKKQKKYYLTNNYRAYSLLTNPEGKMKKNVRCTHIRLWSKCALFTVNFLNYFFFMIFAFYFLLHNCILTQIIFSHHIWMGSKWIFNYVMIQALLIIHLVNHNKCSFKTIHL